MGRASKNEWTFIQEVGPKFFQDIDKKRQWHFDFDDYYDVCIWDVDAGSPFSVLYSTIQGIYTLHTMRVSTMADNPAAAHQSPALLYGQG